MSKGWKKFVFSGLLSAIMLTSIYAYKMFKYLIFLNKHTVYA